MNGQFSNIKSPVEPSDELGYGHLLKILGRRIYWFGGGLVGCVGLAVLITLLRSPTYRSSMQLLVEPNLASVVGINGEGDRSSSFQEVELDYVTQLNLMRSEPFIEQAMEIIEAGNPDLCEGTDSRAVCLEDFYDAFALSQVEEDDTQTRIFEATFTSDHPLRTQKSLQALQSVYLSYNTEQQKQRLDQGLDLVNQQIAEVETDLSLSQQALQQFRQTTTLIAPEEQSLSAVAAIEQVVQDKQAAQVDYQATSAQYEALQQALALDPQQAMMAALLSESDRYQRLLDALQTSELALAERLSVYTESDPLAQDLAAERDRQASLLRQESRRLIGREGTDMARSGGQLGTLSLNLVQEMISAQIKLRGLESRLSALTQNEQLLQQELGDYPSLIAQYDSLQPAVETQRNSLDRLLTTRQELSNELAQGGFKWDVVEPPKPGREISSSPTQNLALGAIAGLFLGGLLAYGREAIDTVVRTSGDLEKQTAMPLLGVLPEVFAPASRFVAISRKFQFQPAESTARASLLQIVQAEPFREAVDLIYKNMQLTAGSLASVMVTSAVEQEGKTTLAVGLALSAARSQKRVLLVDADLRHPCLHSQLGLSNHHGLTTLLDSSADPMPVSVSFGSVQVDILTAGPLSEDPVRLLNSTRMKELFAQLKHQYDLIVFDTSTLLGRVDALQIASFCQNVVMVSRLDQITQSNLAQSTALLARVNTLGIVANSCRDSAAPELEEVADFSLNGNSNGDRSVVHR